MSIEQCITEDCLRVQIAGSVDMHLLPLKTVLKVVPVPHSHSEFPESPYEFEEYNVRNQLTIMDYMRSRSRLSESSFGSIKSQPCSAISTASSIKTSYSSLDTDSVAMGLPPIVESEYIFKHFYVFVFLFINKDCL